MSLAMRYKNLTWNSEESIFKCHNRRNYYFLWLNSCSNPAPYTFFNTKTSLCERQIPGDDIIDSGRESVPRRVLQFLCRFCDIHQTWGAHHPYFMAGEGRISLAPKDPDSFNDTGKNICREIRPVRLWCWKLESLREGIHQLSWCAIKAFHIIRLVIGFRWFTSEPKTMCDITSIRQRNLLIPIPNKE